MAHVLKSVKKVFYKVREWYDPTITSVSKPMERPGANFYPVYEFNVHYGEKIEPVIVYFDDTLNWIGKTPEKVAWDLYNHYVDKMRKQQRNR